MRNKIRIKVKVGTGSASKWEEESGFGSALKGCESANLARRYRSGPLGQLGPEEPKIQLNGRLRRKFLIGIFIRDLWAQTQVFSGSSFCLVFYPHFSVLQNAICRDPSRHFFLSIATTSNKNFENWSNWKLEIQMLPSQRESHKTGVAKRNICLSPP